jgi:hypothetical protein
VPLAHGAAEGGQRLLEERLRLREAALVVEVDPQVDGGEGRVRVPLAQPPLQHRQRLAEMRLRLGVLVLGLEGGGDVVQDRGDVRVVRA